MVFAANFEAVSSPQTVAGWARGAAGAAGGVREEFRVEAPALVEAGTEVKARVWLKGAGRVQGFSARLAWDRTVVEPEGVSGSGWVEGQGGVVLTPGPGVVDAALLGTRERGMTGEGEVAAVTFRVLRSGDAGIGLAAVEARDAANRSVGAEALGVTSAHAAPGRTALLAPWPNPFAGEATVVFSLAQGGAVELSVYGVDGRRVRQLVGEPRAAGVYRVSWDGRDERRHPVPPGVYFLRLSAGGRAYRRTLVYLR